MRQKEIDRLEANIRKTATGIEPSKLGFASAWCVWAIDNERRRVRRLHRRSTEARGKGERRG